MKNAVILHGTGETPEYMWLPWVKKELEKKGYSVSIPQLPDTDNPTLSNWLPAALKEKYNKDTVLIGHSAGGPLQLSVLENINVRIKQAILVAGYARRKGDEKEAEGGKEEVRSDKRRKEARRDGRRREEVETEKRQKEAKRR